MTHRRIQGLFAVSVVCIGAAILLAAPAPVVSKPSETEVDAYIKLHQDILDILRESFKKPHPYVDATNLHPHEAEFAWPQSIKEHEKHTLMTSQYDGQGIKKYLIMLNLKQEALPAISSGNSDTMEATVLLNHYFRPLERLGLANPSSPLAAVSAVQYSAGEWIPKDRYTTPQDADSPAWVEGEVFLARQAGQVVIRVTVGGRYVPKGT